MSARVGAIALLVLLGAVAFAEDEKAEPPSFATVIADGRDLLDDGQYGRASLVFERARREAHEAKRTDDEALAAFWYATAELRGGHTLTASCAVDDVGSGMALNDVRRVAVQILRAEVKDAEDEADLALDDAAYARLCAETLLGDRALETARARACFARYRLGMPKDTPAKYRDEALAGLGSACAAFDAVGARRAHPSSEFAPILRLYGQVAALDAIEKREGSWLAQRLGLIHAWDAGGGRPITRYLAARAVEVCENGSLALACELAAIGSFVGRDLPERDPAKSALRFAGAELDVATGRLDAAQAVFEKALDDVRSRNGRAHDYLAPTLGLARIALARGRPDEARRLIRDDRFNLLVEPSDIKAWHMVNADVVAAGDRADEALGFLNAYVAPIASASTLGVFEQASLGRLMLRAGDREAARSVLERALVAAEKTLDADDPRRAGLRDAFARASGSK